MHINAQLRSAQRTQIISPIRLYKHKTYIHARERASICTIPSKYRTSVLLFISQKVLAALSWISNASISACTAFIISTQCGSVSHLSWGMNPGGQCQWEREDEEEEVATAAPSPLPGASPSAAPPPPVMGGAEGRYWDGIIPSARSSS